MAKNMRGKRKSREEMMTTTMNRTRSARATRRAMGRRKRMMVKQRHRVATTEKSDTFSIIPFLCKLKLLSKVSLPCAHTLRSGTTLKYPLPHANHKPRGGVCVLFIPYRTKFPPCRPSISHQPLRLYPIHLKLSHEEDRLQQRGFLKPSPHASSA
jgi:hypothetical protein